MGVRAKSLKSSQSLEPSLPAEAELLPPTGTGIGENKSMGLELCGHSRRCSSTCLSPGWSLGLWSWAPPSRGEMAATDDKTSEIAAANLKFTTSQPATRAGAPAEAPPAGR